MKSKTRKTDTKKTNSLKSVKPAISANGIKKALKNVVKANLDEEVGFTGRQHRGTKNEIPKANQRRARNVISKLADHTEASSSQAHKKAEAVSKRKQVSLLEVPSLPTTNGTVFVVGENDVGQLGLENVLKKKRPFPLPLPEPMVDIAAGSFFSVCLSVSGRVYTFGCNDHGFLGRVTEESENPVPEVVNLPESIVMISAGDAHAAALSNTGRVYAWGMFRRQQGDMGLTPDGQWQVNPSMILENVTVVKISSGNNHLVCLANDYKVYTCGNGEGGQLGRLAERSAEDGGRKGLHALLVPSVIHAHDRGTPLRFNDIWTGSYSTFLREKRTGRVYACGLNNCCHLGYQGERARYALIRVNAFSDNTCEISGGEHHTLSLNTLGAVHAIGRHEYGRLGLGGEADVEVLTAIPSLQNEQCSHICCGERTSYAVSKNGILYSWGQGDMFLLGHGSEDDVNVPTVVEGNLSTWRTIKVSSKGQHVLILACPKE